MHKRHLLAALTSCVLAFMPHLSDAASIPSYLLPYEVEGATIKSSIWDDLTTSRLDPDNTGTYGKNPGRTTSIWPTANTILANKGSENLTATLGSHSIGQDEALGGGPYIGSGSLHFGSRRASTNVLGGTLSLSETSVQEGLQTIVLQIWAGQARGYDLYGAPTLYLNGSEEGIAATYESFGYYKHDTGGSFTVEGESHKIYQTLNIFQWDLSTVFDPILSFEIRFSGVENSGVYAIQLDQIDTAVPDAVPEPTTWSLIAAAGFAALVVRRKQLSKKA